MKRIQDLEQVLQKDTHDNCPSPVVMLNDTVPVNKDKLDLLKISCQDKASVFVGGLAELVFGEDILKIHSIRGKANNEYKQPKKPALDSTSLNVVLSGYQQWVQERS